MAQARALFESGPAADRRAIQLLRGVVRRNPQFAEANAALAAVLSATGDAGGAEEAYAAAEGPPWGDPALARPETYDRLLNWGPRLREAMVTFLAS